MFSFDFSNDEKTRLIQILRRDFEKSLVVPQRLCLFEVNSMLLTV